ncbi:hypothetical protein ACQ4PT_007052 [Festuca glaucescens]
MGEAGCERRRARPAASGNWRGDVRRAGREELRAGTTASGGRDGGVGGCERAEPAASGDIPCSVRRASREELRAGPAASAAVGAADAAASGGCGGGVGGCYASADEGWRSRYVPYDAAWDVGYAVVNQWSQFYGNQQMSPAAFNPMMVMPQGSFNPLVPQNSNSQGSSVGLNNSTQQQQTSGGSKNKKKVQKPQGSDGNKSNTDAGLVLNWLLMLDLDLFWIPSSKMSYATTVVEGPEAVQWLNMDNVGIVVVKDGDIRERTGYKTVAAGFVPKDLEESVKNRVFGMERAHVSAHAIVLRSAEDNIEESLLRWFDAESDEEVEKTIENDNQNTITEDQPTQLHPSLAWKEKKNWALSKQQV